MRVLTICDPAGVSEFYRTLTPYRLLAEAGEIELTQDSGESPAIIGHLNDFDVVVFSRPDSAPHALILAEANRLGVKTVVDVDDNLFLLPPSISAYGAWHKRGSGAVMPRLWYHKYCIKQADLLTVSTLALGRQLCGGEPLRLRQPGDYMVLPNQVLASEWADGGPGDLVKPAGEKWAGWWGIYNHWDDWRDIAPYIEPVIAERPDVKLVLLGMPELAHLFPALRKTDQLILGEFVFPEETAPYRALIKQFDVALAPTSPGAFNEAKSDLKMLQYGAAGVPVIASAVTYAEWSEEAVILDEPEEWATALAHALAFSEDGRRLQARVLENRTYEGNFKKWLQALK